MNRSSSRVAFAATLLAILLHAPCFGEPAASLVGKVREHRLSNGLTVLALRRAGAPTVSLQMTFVAGGVDEPSGRTGMAHVMEHMLFKGTRTIVVLKRVGERRP